MGLLDGTVLTPTPRGSRFLRNLIAAAFHTTAALCSKGLDAASLLMVEASTA
jgi:hypothetical protein